MCGRFTFTASPRKLMEMGYSNIEGLDIRPRYNIASTQKVLAVPKKPVPGPQFFCWGLIPILHQRPQEDAAHDQCTGGDQASLKPS